MRKLIPNQFYFFVLFTCIVFNKINAQTYCNPININGNSSFFVSNITLEGINNSSNNTASQYTFYNSLTTDVLKGSTYSSSITFAMDNYNEATARVWIDFNNDGDFTDSDEQVYSFTGSTSASSNGITKTFQITIPTTANTANTRMRVAIKRGNTIDPCNLSYQNGEVEDYNINIKPNAIPPTAVCNGSINVTLDVSGNASITTADVNNGSFDDFDAANDLILSLDRYNFNCDDISSPVTVTLTVEDKDGLTDACTTTVNVAAFAGIFQSPTLDDVTAFCSYTAEAPVMNYQCGQEITATTSDITTFSSSGNYTINWVFDNGTTTATSTQNINILTPSTPTNVSITNINETTATVSWDSSENTSYTIRHRLNGSNDTWTETTSNTNSKTITSLDDGFEYEVQVKIESDCGLYTNSSLFTTTEVQYCDSNVNIYKNNQYYISNVNIGNINNTTPNNDDVYKYFNTISTNLVIGETFSGNITYSRQRYNNTTLVVWIDFNNDGDFDDAGEEIENITNNADANTVFNISLSNILVPTSSTLGKTRLRVGLKHGQAPTSACNFDFQNGEIEDYNVFLNAPDNTLFESALITQVYHYGTDRWIEVTNTNTTETIPANTLALALFKNTSGAQINITPSATLLISTELTPGESTLIKSSASTLSSYLGTAIENTAISDFDGADDILIISKKTDNSAWENRFDVISNISNNTSYVRSDEVTTYNNSYTSSEWISFIDDTLLTTTNPPERHPHAPLISEVINGNRTSNVKLGLHNINKTIRTGGNWNNGYPDRSRRVLISEDLSLSEELGALQLEIDNSVKLVVNNELVVVSNNLNINATGQIRLVGTSQLIQTHTGAKNITGLGKIYVDQNSTVPSYYRYNFMSSPVVSSGSNTYSLLDVMKDGTTPTSLTSVPKDINYINGYDGNYSNSPTGSIDIAEHWIYTYDNNGSNYGYIHKYSTGTIEPGKGYIFKGPGRVQNYTYLGTPNDGNYTYTVTADEYILLGNPYASALNTKKFIEDNQDSTTGTLYFWEHASESKSDENLGHYSTNYIGGYATRNISMGVSAINVSGNSNTVVGFQYTEPKQYIPIAQGFFIQSDSDGGTIEFNNSQREYVTEGESSVFFRTENKKANTNKSSLESTPILKLGMDFKNENNKFLHRQVGISFNENNSFAYDKNFDSEIFDINTTDIYWNFSEWNDKNLVIASVGKITNDLEIPLTIKVATKEEIIIKVDEEQNINRELYLIDKLEGISYNFNKQIKLKLENGIYSKRFYLAFKPTSTLNNEAINILENEINFFLNKNTKEIIVKNSGNVTIIKAELFNLLGQKVQKWKNLETTSIQKLKVNNLPSALYVIKLKTEKGILTKKIIIN